MGCQLRPAYVGSALQIDMICDLPISVGILIYINYKTLMMIFNG